MQSLDGAWELYYSYIMLKISAIISLNILLKFNLIEKCVITKYRCGGVLRTRLNNFLTLVPGSAWFCFELWLLENSQKNFLQVRLLSKIVILNRDSFLVTLMVDVVHEAIARVCFFAWEVDRITNWIVYWTYLSIY